MAFGESKACWGTSDPPKVKAGYPVYSNCGVFAGVEPGGGGDGRKFSMHHSGRKGT